MITTSVKKADLSITMFDRTFFSAAAIESQKRIRKRTETDGKDYLERPFNKYTPAYSKARAKGKAQKGVGPRQVSKPNLSMSTKMLGGMKTKVTNKKGTVVLSGEQAAKARGNEANGRIFFAFTEKDRDKVLSIAAKWMAKKNNLKR